MTITRAEVVSGTAVPSIGALLRLVGGSPVVTGFLRQHGIEGMCVDLGEGDVDRIFDETANRQTIPANETDVAMRI